VLTVGMALGLCLASVRAGAVTPDEAKTEFDAATSSLNAGAPTQAIQRLELLADRGFLHPDASFNRAVAYLRRAESPMARPGDRGKAVAALSETLTLRPSDEAAERLLDAVQEQIAKRHGDRETLGVSRPPLGLVLVGLLPEHGWAMLSLLSAWLLALGVTVRRWGRQDIVRLAATIVASVATVGMTLGTGMLLGRAHLLHTTQQAVVITETARLLDASGRPLPGKVAVTTLPEGAEVTVTESSERLRRVTTGEREGWVSAEQLHLLPPRL